MIVVGLDTSTYTGMARLDTETGDLVGKCVNFPKLKGYDRLQSIARESRRIIENWQPDRIYIEGFAIYRVSSVVAVVSCGVIVRQMLYELGLNWCEVPPSTLKKWTTGKGNADKKAMAASALSRWGQKSPSDDIIDAVCLAQFGHQHTSDPQHPDQRGARGVSQGW